MAREIDSKEFTAEVLEGSGSALIDFWAPWCAPCLMQGPIVPEVAAKVGDEAKAAKVNVEGAPHVASHLGIRSIPTLIVFTDGAPAEQLVGVTREDHQLAAIDSAQERRFVSDKNPE